MKRLKKTTRCYACTEDTKGVFKMARDLHSRIAAIKARGKERTQAGDDEEDEWKGEHSEQHRHGDECTHRHAVGDSHSEHYISSSDLEEECDGDGRDPKAPAFSTLTRIEGAKPEAENFYHLLGCEPTDDTATLKAALRTKQLQCHPDKCASLPPDQQSFRRSLFDALSRAWQALGDTECRKRYDAILRQAQLQESAGPSCPVQCEIPWSAFLEDDDPKIDPSEIYAVSCRCGGEFIIEGIAALARKPYAYCFQCSLVAKISYPMAGKDLNLKEPDDSDRGPFQASKSDFDATRRRKALCLKNALTIVERFGMNPITVEMVGIALPWLEREQYDDIPVERVGYGNCGYLLCVKPIGTTRIQQQYRISSSRRCVYEVGDRKYFCSDWCYRASCYLRRQIPSEPAWCRPLPTGPMIGLKFLPENAPGRPGKTILDALRHLRLNADIENEGDKKDSSSDEQGSEQGDEESCASEPDNEETVETGPQPWNEVIPRIGSTKVIERKVSAEFNTTSTAGVDIGSYTAVKNTNNLADCVLARLQEWMTKRAVEALFSNEPYASNDPPIHTPSCEVKCDDMIPPAEQPITTIMPLVDSVSQKSYRLRLLMESLLPSLKKILFRLEVSFTAVYSKLQNAMAEFNLSNKNLHLRPKEANLVCLCLLHLLLRGDSHTWRQGRLLEMIGDFDDLNDQAQEFLSQVREIADKLQEDSLDSPS
ncbi:unnamed protein product [Mesocestoides corti]|uniref:RNA polymerase II subunit B1 CTD phosphatase RPAP2 homolog n=2 Tax=Mesocestoides corti TaxID=53468 RepID=A0A3P6GRI6_MESCO|nr:unnamed protein product [Mesocestoides corti]